MSKNQEEEVQSTSTEETSETSEEEVETSEEGEEEAPLQEIDYEAELAKERERADTAEQAIIKAKLKVKKEKENAGSSEGEEDKPLTRREAEMLFESQRKILQKEAHSDRIREIATQISSSDKEANLVVEIHKNRSFPENLSLREQLEESWAIANRKKLLATNAELVRALRSKDSAGNDTAVAHQETLKGSTPKLSANDKASYQRAGFTFNTTSKVWEKQLPNGKTLIKGVRGGATRLK